MNIILKVFSSCGCADRKAQLKSVIEYSSTENNNHDNVNSPKSKTVDDSSRAIAHYNLGCALQEKGKLIDAVACYRECISIIPSHVDSH